MITITPYGWYEINKSHRALRRKWANNGIGHGHHTNLYVKELLSRKGRTNSLIRSLCCECRPERPSDVVIKTTPRCSGGLSGGAVTVWRRRQNNARTSRSLKYDDWFSHSAPQIQTSVSDAHRKLHSPCKYWSVTSNECDADSPTSKGLLLLAKTARYVFL